MKEQILSDAISKYIEAEHMIIKLKRVIVVELLLILGLLVIVIVR